MRFNREKRLVFGVTRIVLLYRDKAYKIPTCRLLFVAIHFSNHFLSRLSERKQDGKGSRPLKPMTLLKSIAVVAFNFSRHMHPKHSGLVANRREYRRWKEHKSRKLAPVLGMYFGGFLLIQKRANQYAPLPDAFLSIASPHGDGGPTDDRPPNHGFLNGEKVWIDYGGEQCPL